MILTAIEHSILLFYKDLRTPVLRRDFISRDQGTMVGVMPVICCLNVPEFLTFVDSP